MSQIRDELERLGHAFLNPTKVVSAELLAEEIAARSGRTYEWNDDLVMAVFQLVSGSVIKITGNESDRVPGVAARGWPVEEIDDFFNRGLSSIARADEARSDAAHQARAAHVADAAQIAATDNLAAADAWDVLASHATKHAIACRRGAALADRTRRRWATSR